MAKPLLIHPEALREAEVAVEWYGKRSQRAVKDFLTELDRGSRRLLEHPVQFPELHFGVRVAVLRRFPYVIVFREIAAAIQIVAIAHGRRRQTIGEVEFCSVLRDDLGLDAMRQPSACPTSLL